MEREPGSRDAGDADARIHTFLIADVRGYTLFTQERGDEAAAKLAAKFADTARETIERYAGRALEFRGDEVLALFASARQAVRAAVELQERFVDETIADPELPLPVGIGLDAGEAVPVEEGYRGGALNLAARLCGQARAGEILASSGVTHLARKVDGVRYVDRGSLTLKNLAEPVRVVRVLPEGIDPAERLRSTLPSTSPAPRRTRTRVAVAAVLAVAVAVTASILALRRDGTLAIAAGAVGFVDGSGDLQGSVDVGELPRGVARGGGALWITDQESGTLIRVDPTTYRVDERIPVGAGPTGVVTAAGFVWVTNTDDRTVSVIDPEAPRPVVQTIVVGNGPAGIAADGDRVWVANSVDASVSEIDASEGTVEGIHPVGDRPVAVVAGAGAVWVANERSGTISRVVSGDGETQQIPVGRGPASLAFGEGALWVANAEAGTVARVDPATGAVTATEIGGSPVAVATGAGAVWVATAGDGTVVRIDPESGDVSETLTIGNAPRALVGTADGVWVGVQAAPAAHRGGTLRIVSASGLETIDPHAINERGFTASVLATAYDGLVTFRRAAGAQGLTVVPDLAVALPEPTDGGRTYTFQLRDGIRFSDGHELTPADVVATFERILTSSAAYGPFSLPELVGASSCTPDDPGTCDLSRGVVADDAAGTVTMHLVRPAPDLLSILATPFFSILPAGTPADLGGVPAPATGPYVIDDVADDGSAVLERNPGFREWSVEAQPAAFADRIEISTGAEPEEQVAIVESGEADLTADRVPEDLVPELERRASSQLVRSPVFALAGITLNVADAPFDDRDARRAVAYALDRAEMARLSTQTLGLSLQVTCQVIPPNIPGYAPYCPFTTPGGETEGSWVGPDITRARELVRRSGTADEEVVVAVPPFFKAVAKGVASMLGDLDYRAEVRIVRTRRGIISPRTMPSDADVSLIVWFQDYPSAVQFLGPLLGCRARDRDPAIPAAVVAGSENLSNFCDPGIDRRVRRALTLKLTDPFESAREFHEIDRDLVDLAPIVPFGNAVNVSLVSERVGNVQYNPQLGVLISQMWIG